ncbi:hypothetical protein PPF1_72 [Rhizobium phage vB_RleM_PPF1]|uniref:hypothetical protein n=1 Tax=Rhizobium phage vB_RleM_PPF1 TaxID=1498228 RepID=UPI00049A85BF|nr:hypothetical protein PPF1_72 [Rhizobium phage vB_RleM_PPF1]AID18385.1 hypothetical protein PPF1_72 [Rhizobium phage vB_RleM_PPF1]
MKWFIGFPLCSSVSEPAAFLVAAVTEADRQAAVAYSSVRSCSATAGPIVSICSLVKPARIRSVSVCVPHSRYRVSISVLMSRTGAAGVWVLDFLGMRLAPGLALHTRENPA